MSPGPKKKLLFVCLGNICRSPLAHAAFDAHVKKAGLSDTFFTESSGTGGWHTGENADPRTREVGAKNGVPVDHLARKFHASDLREYDLILAMDKANLRDILRHAKSPEEKKKVRLMRDFDPSPGDGEVPDPYYGGPADFQNVFDIVDRSTKNLLDRILAHEI